MKKLEKTKYILALIISCGLIAGCGTKDDNHPIIMVDASEDEIVYNMDEVGKGDVLLTKNVNCKYVQTSDQQISFPMGGKIVDKVYVKVGDSVNVGDLLVELENGSIVDEIASLEYQIKRTELQLGYLDDSEKYDKQNAYYSLAYGSNDSEDDVKAYDKQIEEIEERYTYQREDYNDSLEFDRMKLAKLKTEYEGNRVYATMAGKVLDIKKNLEGSTAKKDDVIMTIVDNETGLFEINDKEAAKFFKEGQSVAMSIVYGDGKGDYELIPHDMSSWGESQYFEVLVSPDTATLTVGTSGTILATIDERIDVVRIPVKALYESNGRYYTYVLNENNMREPQFIEIGLVGNDYAEVIGGIEVGTKVVRR